MSWSAFILWLILRAVGIKCSRQEVKERRYDPSPHRSSALEKLRTQEASPILLDLVRALYDAESERTAAVQDKGKTLLTLSGLLFPLFVVAMNIAGPVGWGLIPLGLLLLTLYLLTELLAVKTKSQPALDRGLLDFRESNQRARLIVSYWTAREYNRRSNEFFVDLFRAARRIFLATLLAVFVIVGITTASLKSSETRFVEKLRTDAELVQLLSGAPGAIGPPGPQGVVGPAGPPGPPGICSCKEVKTKPVQKDSRHSSKRESRRNLR